MTGWTPQPGQPHILRHAPVVCRACGADNDAATHTGGGNPRPSHGDVSICLDCGEVSIFELSPLGDQVTLREPTLDELAEAVRVHGDVIRERAAWRAGR